MELFGSVNLYERIYNYISYPATSQTDGASGISQESLDMREFAEGLTTAYYQLKLLRPASVAVVVELKCGYAFCQPCIDSWLFKDPKDLFGSVLETTCPYCRVPVISIEDVHWESEDEEVEDGGWEVWVSDEDWIARPFQDVSLDEDEDDEDDVDDEEENLLGLANFESLKTIQPAPQASGEPSPANSGRFEPTCS